MLSEPAFAPVGTSRCGRVRSVPVQYLIRYSRATTSAMYEPSNRVRIPIYRQRQRSSPLALLGVFRAGQVPVHRGGPSHLRAETWTAHVLSLAQPTQATVLSSSARPQATPIRPGLQQHSDAAAVRSSGRITRARTPNTRAGADRECHPADRGLSARRGPSESSRHTIGAGKGLLPARLSRYTSAVEAQGVSPSTR